MALNKYRLGDLIEVYKQKCGISNLTPYQVSGVNKEKEFFEPSNQVGEDTSKYQNVPPKYYACNLMHVGRDCVLPIAYNHSEETKHVSPAYTVFKIKNNKIVLDFYFFMLLKSDEKDRFFWFNCDASVRDGMSIDDFKNIEIELPDIETQQKFVNIYLSMVENQKSYERGLDDLKLVCDGFIEDLRKKYPVESISDYLIERTETNKNGEINFMKGIGLLGFIEPNQVRTEESLRKCNVFYKNDFVYAPSSFKNGVISYNDKFEKAICTEEYIVFYINDCQKLNQYYLLMWLKRKQLGRYIDFSSCDSVRNRFYFKDLNIIEIPVPEKEIQDRIANIYKVYLDRKELVDRLKNQIKDMCPILIKGSIEEARGE